MGKPADKPTHDLIYEEAGKSTLIWRAYVRGDEGVDIRFGKKSGQLKSLWIPASKCDNDSPVSEALKRAQDKLAEGYAMADNSQPADPDPATNPKRQSKPTGSTSKTGIEWGGGDWIW